MTSQLNPHMTVPTAIVGHTAHGVAAVRAARRAAIRLRARRVARGMIRELVTVPQIAAPPRTPLFVRLDALQARYAQLGGDPADLVR
jgi:hypothetical protein